MISGSSFSNASFRVRDTWSQQQEILDSNDSSAQNSASENGLHATVNASGWKNFVDAHPAATPFHTENWFRVLTHTYGFQPYRLALEDRDGNIAAVIPFLEVHRWLGGRNGISLPFTDFCSPLRGNNREHGQIDQLYEAAIQLGKSREWRFLEFRDAPSSLFNGQEPSVRFYTHNLDLGLIRERGDRCLSPHHKRAVRQGEKSNLKLSIHTDSEAMEKYFELHCLTRRKHGMPPQPFAFFQNIQRHMLEKGLGEIFLATANGRSVAGAIFFRYGSHVTYKFGASHSQFLSDRPNHWLMWQAIQHYANVGMKNLNFGRTSLHHEGLSQFKRRFGAVEQEGGYYRVNLETGKHESMTDATTRFHRNIFQHLPVGLSKFLGTVIYRMSGPNRW